MFWDEAIASSLRTRRTTTHAALPQGELARGARTGCRRCRRALDQTRFSSFDDYWQPLLEGKVRLGICGDALGEPASSSGFASGSA